MFKACLFFLLLWWWLIGWQPASLVVGLPFILLAAYSLTGLRQAKHEPINWRAALHYLGYFLLQTVQGTWSVGKLALKRHASQQEGVVFPYSMSIQSVYGRMVFINSVSLLPGSLVIKFDGQQIMIHSIDATNTGESGIKECEKKIAAIFASAEPQTD